MAAKLAGDARGEEEEEEEDTTIREGDVVMIFNHPRDVLFHNIAQNLKK